MHLKTNIATLVSSYLALFIFGAVLVPNFTYAQAPNASVFDTQLDRIERLLPAASSLAEGCEGDECGPPVCQGQLDVFRDLMNLTPVLEQYVQTLNAEDAILTRGSDDAIAANDLSAAALEGARIAASMTHVTDQTLGAVVEINGIIDFMSAPSLEPTAVWEFSKDVNSIINRLYDGWADVGNQIESARYDPDKETGKGTGINIKAVEDAYIDIWSFGAVDTGEVKANTSNMVDGIGLVKNMMKDVEKIKDAKGQIASLEEYRRRYTKAASPGFRKALDKAFENGIKKQNTAISKSKEGAARGAAFALTQIAARAVQNYYSAEKLKAFRERITQLRGQAVQAGDRYLTTIQERDRVRDRSRRVADLLARVRNTSNVLRECAFKNCARNVSTVEMIALPPMSKRENGNLQYAAAQANIAPVLTAITLSLTQNILNKGGSKPAYPDGAELSGPVFLDASFGAACEKCQRYYDDASAASRQLKFILWNLDQLDDGGKLKQLNSQRDIALQDATDLQQRYNDKTDGSLGRRLVNLTDGAQQELSELSSQIRRKTSEVRSLSQQIAVINKNLEQAANLKRQANEQRAKQMLAAKKLEICNSEICSNGQSISYLKQSYPSFENDEDKCGVPDVVVIDVVNRDAFGCSLQSFLQPGISKGAIGIPEDAVYFDYNREKIIPPFGPEDTCQSHYKKGPDRSLKWACHV